VEPPEEPEPAFSALDTFFIDVFTSVLGGPSAIEQPLLPFALVGELSPLPAGFPVLSGAAEPGSNIMLTFYSATGELVFSNNILVPSGGNWVASLPAAERKGGCHRCRSGNGEQFHAVFHRQQLQLPRELRDVDGVVLRFSFADHRQGFLRSGLPPD
jgi:hypothetical protein